MNSLMNLSPKDKKKLQGMIQEVANSFIRVDGEREFVKDVKKRAKEELDIPPKLLSQWARICQKNILQEMKMEAETLFSTYESVFMNRSDKDND